MVPPRPLPREVPHHRLAHHRGPGGLILEDVERAERARGAHWVADLNRARERGLRPHRLDLALAGGLVARADEIENLLPRRQPGLVFWLGLNHFLFYLIQFYLNIFDKNKHCKCVNFDFLLAIFLVILF